MNLNRQKGNFGAFGGTLRAKSSDMTAIVQHWAPSASAGFVAGEDGKTYHVPVGNLPAGVTCLYNAQRVRISVDGDVATVVGLL